MANTLNGTAELITRIKSVYATVYLGEGSALHPELVTTGVAILKKGNLTLGRVEFNADFGNSDGGFNFTFHKQIIINTDDLTLEVDINDGEYTASIIPTVSDRDPFAKTLPNVSEISNRLEL